MRVLVNPNAAEHYRNRCFVRGSYLTFSQHWHDLLQAIEGQWVEVETEYLFNDQYNVGPPPGKPGNGMRLMTYDIVEFVEDPRPETMRCHWCNGHDRGPKADDPSAAGVCYKCGRRAHLKPFKIVYPCGMSHLRVEEDRG